MIEFKAKMSKGTIDFSLVKSPEFLNNDASKTLLTFGIRSVDSDLERRTIQTRIIFNSNDD